EQTADAISLWSKEPPMPVPTPCHPSDRILRALGSGQLDDAGADAAFAHLAICPACRARAASLSDDGFLERLRAAHSAWPSPVGRAGPTPVTGAPVAAWVPSAVPVSAVPPELLNHDQYEVFHELARGGMGIVYLSRNKLLDRPEVLKVINQAYLNQPGALERF